MQSHNERAHVDPARLHLSHHTHLASNNSSSAVGWILLDWPRCACSVPVTVLDHDGQGDPWHAIAKALGVEAHDLLFWEKLGRTAHVPQLPEYQPVDKPQLLLVGAWTTLQPQSLCTA